jgi:hypothetical protein
LIPRVEVENRFKVKAALQGELDPIQAQTKNAFVFSVSPINQAG